MNLFFFALVVSLFCIVWWFVESDVKRERKKTCVFSWLLFYCPLLLMMMMTQHHCQLNTTQQQGMGETTRGICCHCSCSRSRSDRCVCWPPSTTGESYILCHFPSTLAEKRPWSLSPYSRQNFAWLRRENNHSRFQRQLRHRNISFPRRRGRFEIQK